MDESISSPTGPRSLEEAIAYCAAELRRFDRDRYLTCLLAGKKGRAALLSLYAFNLEIAKTRETVSEPMLGQIRLQWWREAIEEIYAGRPRNHAVVTALADTVMRLEPTPERFARMIDGREFDLEDRQPETLDELVAYADATSGELSCLALEALGARDEGLLSAGRSAGIAWALTGLIRAIPFHAAQRRCYLPQDLTADRGLSVEAVSGGRGGEALNRVVEAIALNARAHLESIRVAVHRPLRAGFAPMLLIASDLHRLEQVGYDVFGLKPQAPFSRPWMLIKATLWGRTR